MTVYQSAFSGSVVALQILSFFVVLRFLSFVSGDVLTSIDRQIVRTAIQGCAVVLNVGLNLVLIPRYGLVGAAWATIATEAFLFCSYFVMASRLFVRLPLVKTVGRLAFAGAVPFGAAYFLGFVSWPFGILALLGYAVLVYAAGFFDEYDRRLFLQVMPLRRAPSSVGIG